MMGKKNTWRVINMATPLVSIIIPTYKTNASLKDAIESSISQTYRNIEVIVVDDNDPETEYRAIAETIMKKYKNNKTVKYIKHNSNKNGSAARNTGVRESKGKYVTFLDDDDVYFKNKIEKQMAKILNTDAIICTCYYRKDGIDYTFKDKDDYTADILMMRKAPQTSSFLLSKKAFKQVHGFDESYRRHQDYEFLIRVCQIGKVTLVPEVLYERRTNGVDNRPDSKKMETIKNKFLSEFEYLFPKYNISKQKVFAKNYVPITLSYIKEKKNSDAIRIIKKNISLYYVCCMFSHSINLIMVKLRCKRNK